MTKTPSVPASIKQTKAYNLLRRTRKLWSMKPYYPSHLMELAKAQYHSGNGSNGSGAGNGNDKHIEAGIKWLCLAHDINGDGGVAGFYQFDNGWSASYPETTGYIVITFFDYYHLTKNEEYKKRALEMSDWEISVQMDNGACQSELIDVEAKAVVFNTGQVIGGWVRTYEETGDSKYIDAAARAGDWLMEVQDDDGAWRNYTYNGIPRSYHSRVAWFLLRLYENIKDDRYLQSATKHLDWVLSLKQENGSYDKCGFYDGSPSLTHAIAYTMRGLLEGGLILNHMPYIDAAQHTANAMLDIFESDGFLNAYYNNMWEGVENFTCLTGNAQTSIVWLKFYEMTGDTRYLNAAHKLNNHLKFYQSLGSRNTGIKGGIKGSHPIWGSYMPYRYPNWASKFFVDALMLEDRL